jgi:hypothetical protein
MLPDLPQTETAIVEMTNAFRKENRLAEVKPNPALTAAARAFAAYLAKTGKFAHEADGRQPADRTTEHGYKHCLVAENLASNLDSRGFETRKLATDVVQGWKDSPGHRANILLPEVTEIGVAVAQAPDRHPKFIAVQLFGRPDSLKVTFRIENRSGKSVRYHLGKDRQDLDPRTIVTHTRCGIDALSFELSATAPARFDPRDGDRFVLNAGSAGAIQVDLQRK